MGDKEESMVSSGGNSIYEEETGESVILLRASWAIAGFVGGAAYRYQQKGDYLTFRAYEFATDPMYKFSRAHQFIAHKDTYDADALHEMARIKRSVGDGVSKRSSRVVTPGLISGLSAEDATIYLRALCLCLKEKGDIPFDQSVSFRKKTERCWGEDAVFLCVVNDATEELVRNVPMAMIFVKEIVPNVQEFIDGVPEIMDVESKI